MQWSSQRLIVRLEHGGETVTLLDLPSSPDIAQTRKAYEIIKDLRILDIIDLIDQLEFEREIYRHTRTTPYQARHNIHPSIK